MCVYRGRENMDKYVNTRAYTRYEDRKLKIYTLVGADTHKGKDGDMRR
jgi:hypothetical protein